MSGDSLRRGNLQARRRRAQRAPTGHLRGEDHPAAKLSSDDVRLIRALHADGVLCGAIAEKFETPERTIRDICLMNTRIYE